MPGTEVSLELRVRNTGHVVDQYRFEAVGDAAGWVRFEPASLSLFPGVDGTVAVVVAPPRSPDVVAGAVALGVRVQSQEDPAGSVVEEVALEVAPFAGAVLDLVPRTSRGRRAAVHDLSVENGGNARLTAEVAAVDPNNALAFDVRPAEVEVEPGTVVFARVRVRPRERVLRGPDRHHPFQVLVAPGGEEPALAADGAMVQQAVLPAWLPRAALLALLALALLAVAWLTLLRPAVESTAREAVEEQQAEAQPRIGEGEGSAGSAGDASGAGGSEPAAGAGSAAGGGAAGGGAAGGGTPIDGRLFLTSAGTTSYEVPSAKVLQLTDIVLQNPKGNTGSMTIQRGDTVLLVVALENFRDLDYHFVAPIIFTAGQKLTLAASCTSADCSPSAYFAGFLVDA